MSPRNWTFGENRPVPVWLDRTRFARSTIDGAARMRHRRIVATLKDDDPVKVAPFDAITFSLADLRA
jgi:hypothetical protein